MLSSMFRKWKNLSNGE